MSELSEHIVSAPVVILTGAGASAPLGKATTEAFMERVVGLPLSDQVLRVFETVRKACTPSKGVQMVDIEVVLDQLAACVEATDALRGDASFRPILFDRNPPQRDIETLVKQYCDLREALLDEVVRHYGQVEKARAAELYRPLLVGIPKMLKVSTVPLFTLNYDLAVESATDALDLRLIDGVNRRPVVDRMWSAEHFHAFPGYKSTTIVLFKLHGSVSWCRDGEGTIREVVGLDRDPRPLKHVLMYPSLRNKNLAGEPWSTAYGYLRACLGRAKVAVIIGTSLRDAQVVDTFKSALGENPALALVFVGPSCDHEEWSRRLDLKPSRVAAIAASFEHEFTRSAALRAVSLIAAGKGERALGRTLGLPRHHIATNRPPAPA